MGARLRPEPSGSVPDPCGSERRTELRRRCTGRILSRFDALRCVLSLYGNDGPIQLSNHERRYVLRSQTRKLPLPVVRVWQRQRQLCVRYQRRYPRSHQLRYVARGSTKTTGHVRSSDGPSGSDRPTMRRTERQQWYPWDSCNSWYRCVNGSPTAITACPPGTLWDTRYNTCGHANTV